MAVEMQRSYSSLRIVPWISTTSETNGAGGVQVYDTSSESRCWSLWRGSRSTPVCKTQLVTGESCSPSGMTVERLPECPVLRIAEIEASDLEFRRGCPFSGRGSFD